MPSPATIHPAAVVPESQRAALLNLLADDDPAIYHTIRDKILSFGETARDWLRPHTLSSDPVLRRRAQEIIRHFDRAAADNRFLAFCLGHGEEFDIERASWQLAQTQYPDINAEAYGALLDSWAAELRQRITGDEHARPLLTVVNEYVFGELRFAGNGKNYYDPENSYFNRVLDRRTGNPINLCLVYLALARRLRLPMTGIGLPGHFICRYQSASDEVYVDAFNRGKLMTKADCIHYLVKGNYDLREEHLGPVSPRRMLARVCGNLQQIYVRLKHADEATRLHRYLVALSR